MCVCVPQLKGFDGDYREEIDKMLNILQLEDKRDAQSHTLSGKKLLSHSPTGMHATHA